MASYHSPGAFGPLQWGGVSGSCQGRASSVYRLKQIKIWPCGRRALHRTNGSGQSMWGKNGPLPKSTQFSLYLCVSDIPQLSPDLLKSLPRKTVAGPGWPQSVDSSPGYELGTVGPLGVWRVGLVHSHGLMPNGVEYLTQERWHLASVGSVREGLSTDNGECPSSLLPEATLLNFSLYDCSPL